MKIMLHALPTDTKIISIRNAIVANVFLIICVLSQTYGITEAVQKVSEAYKCKPIEGMLSHQLKQFKIDGEKTIIQNPNDAQKKEHEKFEIGPHEVYAMDVLISTGEGVVSSSLFIC